MYRSVQWSRLDFDDFLAESIDVTSTGIRRDRL
jgi:hypothetical protein